MCVVVDENFPFIATLFAALRTDGVLCGRRIAADVMAFA